MSDADGVYRTGSGTVFRITKDADGHLTVATLKDDIWESAPVGMAGLRIARDTRRLTQRQVDALPR
ncbi:MAG TPA: hypothetical protein VIB62_10070 [Actinomycetota bacterium]|jgi:hypothetical protein